MKISLTIILIVMCSILYLTGCMAAPAADTGFNEAEEGIYTCLDTETSPLPNGGVKIDMVKGADGYVMFTVTDNAGTETADYYKFTPSDSTMLRHRCVSAMGMTYNYHFDYNTMTLTSVTDADDKDVSDSLKSMGRWDSAATDTEKLAGDLLAYFETKFGMSVDDAVSK